MTDERCKCDCGCDYGLYSRRSKAEGRCFACRGGSHPGPGRRSKDGG